MDCCNYGEYRGYGWEYGYGPGYAPAPPYYSPYSPYSREYAPQEQYARYHYRYQDYAAPLHHHLDRERSLLEYGGGAAGYASPKECRARRGGRRDAERTRARTPARQVHAPTSPLECNGVSRVPNGYGASHMSWSHYQRGDASRLQLKERTSRSMGGSAWGGAWSARGSGTHPHRDPLRHLAAMHDPCNVRDKTHMPLMEQPATLEPRGAFSYEESAYPARAAEAPHARGPAPEYVDYACAPVAASYERALDPPPRAASPAPPATVPLPAFQQAFGSTEIGKFAEAFSRAEAAHEADADAADLFPEWEAPESAWPPVAAARALKCENSY